MKRLNGEELAEYIMERQGREVRALRQAWQVQPKLALVSRDDPIVEAIQQYGEEVLITVDVHAPENIPVLVESLNADPDVHGIVVYGEKDSSPATEPGVIVAGKDVDALGSDAPFEAVLPMATLWLLAGYNVDIQHGKSVVIVGDDTLVAQQLEQVMQGSEVLVSRITGAAAGAIEALSNADVIIAADGAGEITPAMTKPAAVVVDVTKGEESSVYLLSICALFENVIRAARQIAEDRLARP